MNVLDWRFLDAQIRRHQRNSNILESQTWLFAAIIHFDTSSSSSWRDVLRGMSYAGFLDLIHYYTDSQSLLRGDDPF